MILTSLVCLFGYGTGKSGICNPVSGSTCLILIFWEGRGVIGFGVREGWRENAARLRSIPICIWVSLYFLLDTLALHIRKGNDR